MSMLQHCSDQYLLHFSLQELHGKLIVAVLLVVGITFSMYQPGQPMMRVKPIVKRLVKQPLRYISDNYFKNHIIRVDNWRDLSWEELSEVVPFQGRKHAPKESYFLMTGNEIKALEREEVEKQPIYKEAKEKNRNAVFTSGGLYKQVDTVWRGEAIRIQTVKS